jgi:hypothetical protein
MKRELPDIHLKMECFFPEISKSEARTALAGVLSSGVVSPLNGRPVFEALAK